MTADTAPLFVPANAIDERPLLATLLGADYSALSLTPSQAADAPDVVRAAFARFSTYDARHGRDLNTWRVADLGNAGVRDAPDWQTAYDVIAQLAGRAYDERHFAIALGGDHSVTWPLVAAFRAAHPDQRVGIVQLDVHHDVRPLDDGPSNGTPIRALVDNGIVAGEDVVQVGIHRFANREPLARYCQEAQIHRLTVESVSHEGPFETGRRALALLADCDVLYLTVDIDVLDRAFAPGTVAALPGGLDPAQLTGLVERLCTDPRVRAMDVVEFDPSRDVQSTTAYAAALVVLTALTSVARRQANHP